METRSRKRAEASTSTALSGPSTRAAKRARLSATATATAANANATSPAAAAAATSSVSTTPPSISTRSRTAARSASMDPNPEPSSASASNTRTRRGKNPTTNQTLDNGNSKDGNLDKGKEKETEIRQGETDRNLALNIDSRDVDADDDSEGGVGILHQNLNSASSALQGLLRKLGAGLDDLLPSAAIGSASSSHQNGRLKKILSGLRADGEEGKQIEQLTQLCDMLSIGTEESLSTFSVDSFVPVLVGLLNHESNPDIMLLAARALTHLVDVLPSSCAAVVHYGAVSCFVARLLTIEYMDLAEQSLQALKKISQEHPTACLRAGALMAVLSYLDFFSTGVQRVALATAANMCKKLPSDASDFVMEAVPLLTNLLQYHDAKVLESASICLTRIAEAFASSPEKLDELSNHGLVTQAATLISSSSSGGGQASLSTSTYTGLIRLLSTCASGSPLGAKSLLLLGINNILKEILSGSSLVSNVSVSPALSRPPEQIFEIVNLANELLPPLPPGSISLPASNSMFIRGSLPRKVNAGGSGKQEDSNRSVQEISAREKLLKDQPELLQQFGMDLLPVLIQIYGSSVNGPVRHKCLSVIGKLMYFSSAEMIQSLLNVTNISSFLAGVLAWKDPLVLVPALQIAEILMEKLPDTFSKMFVREGVVHAVDTLIITGSGTSGSQPSSVEKENDSIPGSSSRSRRNRRRGGISGSDANLADNSKSSTPSLVSHPNSVEVPAVNSSLRESVSACAKTFKEKYFSTDSEGTKTGITDDLLRLKNICVKLNMGMADQKTKSKGKPKATAHQPSDILTRKEENLADVITEMLQELSRDDGVSTFEFIGSGAVDSLLNYFTCGYFSKEQLPEANLPQLRQQAMRRYKSFVSVALPTNVSEANLVPLGILVQKLQNALSSLERFPVVLSHASRSSGGNARLSSGLSALSQPFKLRLCRSQGEKSLRDYSSNVVLIDPLASLAAVEDFLWPRVLRNDAVPKPSASAGNSESGTAPATTGVSSPLSFTPAATRRQSSRTRSAVSIGDPTKKDSSLEKNSSSVKAKGKAVLKPNQEDRGPQTRNATRRKAALVKDSDMRPVEEATSSEDDELDISPVEMDESLVIEDEDISDDDDDNDDVLGEPAPYQDDTLPICLPEKVHDVKLGETGEDTPAAPSDAQTNPTSSSTSRGSAEFRGGSSFGSRGTMSFAAATMSGLASGNSRGIRGGRDRHGRSLYGSGESQRLIFTAGGRQLNRHLTIYQAIQRQLVLDEDDDDRFTSGDLVSSEGNRLWGDIYTIMYQRADSQVEKTPPSNASSTTPSKSAKASSSGNCGSETPAHHVSLLDSILQGELPCDMERSNPTYNILALLRILEGLNQLAPRLRLEQVIDNYSEGKVSSLGELSITGVKVSTEDFVSSKLTPKLARQIQDALALCSGSLPSWCYQLTKACPFLFPFETRRQYFYSTAFGLSRALNRLQQQQGTDGHGSASERDVRVGRLQRQKVRVSRNRILDSAIKVMEMYSSQKAVLEVEYFGEVGTGLGPTLEFYTLLSCELQKVGLGMWRSNSFSDRPSMEVDAREQLGARPQELGGHSPSRGEIIHMPLGLFPRPWAPSTDSSDGTQFAKVMEYYRLLGRVMAKALQDGRLLDLPLSVAFYKLILGHELDLHDIISFDAELGNTLLELQALSYRKQYLESKGSYNSEELRFRGASVEDLCLDFSLPGYPDYSLKPSNENVNVDNLGEYVSLVVDATVGTGIKRQMEAFRSGFNQVFDVSALQIFSPNELDYLLCGRRELWKTETLADHIKFDHGYTAKSPAIVNLLEIMGDFTPEQQRAFCQFVTGAPRLPPGGLAVLNPKLTIVRKHSSSLASTVTNGSSSSESADDDLPSVMTCANYLKLPPYSSKEIMYKKLLYAISEGQGSFDLS